VGGEDVTQIRPIENVLERGQHSDPYRRPVISGNKTDERDVSRRISRFRERPISNVYRKMRYIEETTKRGKKVLNVPETKMVLGRLTDTRRRKRARSRWVRKGKRTGW
jgi:hypothetical protein